MRPVISALIVLTLLVSPLARAQEDIPEVARSLMEEAERARDAGRNDDAIAKYARVIEVAPALASAYINLGAIYFKQGKIEDAYKTFTRGVENAPADRTLLSNAAAAAQQLGKSADALKFVDRALETNKKDAALYALRSTILRSLQRNDEALIAQQQAVQLSPDDARLQFSLGNLLYQGGKATAAIAAYRRAVDLDRTYMRAWYNLGAVLFESGKFDEALEAYRVALQPIDQAFAKKEKVDPIHARAYGNLGAIYLRQKKYAEAAEAYQKALRLEPNATDVLYNLAFIDYTTGKLDRAEEEYRKVMAADPSLPLAYLHLGEIAFKKNDAAKTIQLLTQGMPHFDRDTRLAALHTLGRAQIARGDRAGAHTTYEEIAREQPDAVDAILHLTYEKFLAARDAGDLAAERTALETLMAHGATDAMRAEHALLLIRQGDIATAQSELALAPNARALLPPFAQAILDASAGKRDAAARALAQLNSPLAKGNAGLLLWQLGRDADARANLVAARTAFPDWNEVTVALADIAYRAKRWDEVITLASDLKCDDELCARAKRQLNAASLEAALDVLQSSPRRAMQLAERAGNDATALFIRGTAELGTGDLANARDLLGRAISGGLSPALESAAKKNLEAAQPPVEVPQVIEPTSSTQRRTVVVFLPDAPVENDRKLAEAVNGMVASSAVPLQVEFFRRAEDARTFFNMNRDRVGIIIANPEFTVSSDFTPRYQFNREGRRTYTRVIVVPAKSPVKNMNDLRGKTMSVVEILGEMGPAEVVKVSDDLTAIANVLYGKTDAALVSEANPLLQQRAADLRVIASSSPQPLPVVSFAPMPESDRTAIDAALRGAQSAIGSLTRIERETPAQPKREITYVTSLNLRPFDPVANVPLRFTADLPKIEIPEPQM
jgi:tetratricopeptide (TPR) repeat protein